MSWLPSMAVDASGGPEVPAVSGPFPLASLQAPPRLEPGGVSIDILPLRAVSDPSVTEIKIEAFFSPRTALSQALTLSERSCR